MKPSPQHARPGKSTAAQAKQTSLQRTLTSALNDLGVEAALVAVFGKEDGPLDLQLFRGFTAREAQAILRSLSAPDLELRHVSPDNGETGKAVRLRLITPSAKSLLALALRYRDRSYGVLVLGRKEGASFTKKEKALVETASEDITAALERAALFDGTLLLSRPWVSEEPPAAGKRAEPSLTPASVGTPEAQVAVQAL